MSGEVALEFRRVRLVLCAGAKDDAALLEASLVLGSMILQNTGANECSHERSGSATGATAGDSSRDRTSDDKADARNGNRCGCRYQCAKRRAHSEANSAHLRGHRFLVRPAACELA